MTRPAQAFAAAETRIDRGRTKERRQAQLEHFAAVAHSTATGVLGGYAPDLQPDVARAHIREFCAHLKASSDGPAVAALVGDICNDLCSDIDGPKASIRKAAERVFPKGAGVVS